MRKKWKSCMSCYKEHRVSVVIPVYNVQEYLPYCVESVIKQKYGDFEIILVNDGSTDNSLKICREYADKYEKITVINQENRGVSAARNAGIKVATGEYIVFLDSDDWWNDDWLSLCMRKIGENNSDCDIMIFGAQKVNVQNNYCEYIGRRFDKFPDGKTGMEVIKYILQNDSKFEWYAWRYVCRTDFLRQESLTFVEGIFYEDVEWTPRVFVKAKKVLYLDVVGLNYRFHNAGSILNTPTLKKSKDKIQVVKMACSYVENNITDSILRKMFKRNFSALYLSAYGDYVNGQIELQEFLAEQFCVLKYNKSRFGRTSYILCKVFGLRRGSDIVKKIIGSEKKFK